MHFERARLTVSRLEREKVRQRWSVANALYSTAYIYFFGKAFFLYGASTMKMI